MNTLHKVKPTKENDVCCLNGYSIYTTPPEQRLKNYRIEKNIVQTTIRGTTTTTFSFEGSNDTLNEIIAKCQRLTNELTE